MEDPLPHSQRERPGVLLLRVRSLFVVAVSSRFLDPSVWWRLKARCAFSNASFIRPLAIHKAAFVPRMQEIRSLLLRCRALQVYVRASSQSRNNSGYVGVHSASSSHSSSWHSVWDRNPKVPVGCPWRLLLLGAVSGSVSTAFLVSK